MEMCITGHSADGKHHSKHMEKHRAFPHPLNNVSHSSVTRPVIHSSTMPAATDHPSSYLPVYHKKKKEQKKAHYEPKQKNREHSQRFTRQDYAPLFFARYRGSKTPKSTLLWGIFCRLALILRTLYQRRPETLLAAMGTALADLVILTPAVSA